MNKGLLIAGIIVLASALVWGVPGGWEFVAIIIQVVVGTFLIVKSRTKAKSSGTSKHLSQERQ